MVQYYPQDIFNMVRTTVIYQYFTIQNFILATIYM